MRRATPGDLQVRRTGEHAVAVFPAEVDGTNAPGIRIALLRLLGSGVPAVIVDLSACRFCDANGVEALLRAHIRATTLTIPLHVVLPEGGQVRAVCRSTGVTRTVALAADVAEAEAAIARTRAEDDR
ncbi:STAS domain-containing protein [Actinomadura scrupuli]|uniref:STAS domain-containing protein n=1 Tax=Actinomadura scrupuli TaxID=559629 RepID=UPI003D97DC69